MGLVDKLKNIFTEEVAEEEEEIKVEQIKKEVRSVPIESPSVERVQRKKTRVEKPRIPIEDEDLLEEDLDFIEEKSKSPVFFTDRDFEDLAAPKKSREKLKAEKVVEEPKKEEAPKPYGGSYSSTTILHKEKQNFKPTPIISPVYGVLDKNYHKEDIIDKNSDASHESVDGLSVDTIRNKAYGTLEDDLEETITSKPKKTSELVDNDVDLFDELEQSALENKKETANSGKDVRKLEEITMDLTKELDNLLLKKEKERKAKEQKKEEPVVEEEKEEELAESDLFNLIDSMYEEGEDE